MHLSRLVETCTGLIGMISSEWFRYRDAAPPDVTRKGIVVLAAASNLMRDLEHRFQAKSGLSDRRYYKIYYSHIHPFPLLVLGYNPGGETDGSDLSASKLFFENWEHDYLCFRAEPRYSLARPMCDLLSSALGTRSVNDLRGKCILDKADLRRTYQWQKSKGAAMKLDITNKIYNDLDAARAHLEEQLWPKVLCPHCGSFTATS